MPVTYEIVPSESIVYLHYDGDPTYQEWATTMEALLRDPRFGPALGVVADRRAVATAPSSEYIRRVATFGQTHAQLHGIPWAVVVSSAEAATMAAFGAKLVGWAATSQQVVFTDLDAARDWVRQRTAERKPPG